MTRLFDACSACRTYAETGATPPERPELDAVIGERWVRMGWSLCAPPIEGPCGCAPGGERCPLCDGSPGGARYPVEIVSGAPAPSVHR